MDDRILIINNIVLLLVINKFLAKSFLMADNISKKKLMRNRLK